ncbi:hypothetical protein [Streptomyces katrae]|uniref:hypothetical protein n=1 Tax=Streptomyces katrae TaxID=68223 RepID=UPI0004BE73C0|nr:hypothetical protein [Streptomyces katrae]
MASATGGGALDPARRAATTAPDAGSDIENGLVIDRRRRIVVSGSSELGGAGGVQWRVQRFTPTARWTAPSAEKTARS